MFDEYYSVSLSFWTRSGLREKARHGHLLGTLPWGYLRDPQSKIAVPDPTRAPLVRGIFERYATGQESRPLNRRMAEYKGARTATQPPVRQGHRPRDALQRLLRRLRLRTARQDPRDPRPARADRPRGALRPRTGGPLLAHHRPQTRPPLRGVPPAQARPLRALRRPHARLPQRQQRHAPLPVLHPPPPRQLRTEDDPGPPLEEQLVAWLHVSSPTPNCSGLRSTPSPRTTGSPATPSAAAS